MPLPGAQTAIELSVLLACVATFVSTLEVVSRPQWLGDNQLLSWPVSRLRHRWLTVSASGSTANRFLRRETFIWLLYFRLALAILTPIADGRTRGVLLLILVLLHAAWSLRSPYGQDGSDQMILLITLTLGLTHVVGTPEARSFGIWFLTAQLCLSYFVACAAKAMSPIWRSGEAIGMVLKTSMYGHPLAYRFIRDTRSLRCISCWLVIMLETLFPVVLIVPSPAALVLIGAMSLFHLATAVLMGLNTFLLAFLAAYPCLLYAVLLH